MPKIKTKSGVKKRFRLTAKGLVRMYRSRRRHGMIKRTQKMKRQSRGGAILSAADQKRVKNFMPYGAGS